MKLYRFDGVDERLDMVPLAARRALDRAGLKLGLDGWRSLSLELRSAIVEAGSAAVVDVTPVHTAVAQAEPSAERIEPIDEPSPGETPVLVARVFGAGPGLPDALWASLSPLDRYALAKVAEKNHAERRRAAFDEIIGHSATSTHLAPRGGVRMVDVSTKPLSQRKATAQSRVSMNSEAFGRLARAAAPKGDVLATARLAAIMAAKRASDIVPLCHPLSLTHVSVDLEADQASQTIRILAHVEAFDRTGVEIEALVAASAAALTVYDMLKAFDRAMEIGPTRLLEKSGGRSGDYRR